MQRLMIRSYVNKYGIVYAEALCLLLRDHCGTFSGPFERACEVRMLNLDKKTECNPGENEPVRASQLRPYPNQCWYCQAVLSPKQKFCNFCNEEQGA
jgi:hypothetical protein